MLVTMRREMFESLDNAALAWACIEPTIQQIRGKPVKLKQQVYARLSGGQRALLMFWVLTGHAQHGVLQFYSEVSYLLAQADIWQEMKAGMGYFGADDMVRLIEEMEALYRALEANPLPGDTVWHGAPAEGGLGNQPELLAAVDRLDIMLRKIAPAAPQRIGAFIRRAPDQFVRIED